MRSDEIRALGKVAGRSLGDAVNVVRDTHLGIAERVFSFVGVPGKPVRVVHDGISRTVYGAVRGAHTLAPQVGAALASVAAPADGEPISASARGNLAVGALNGLWGDRLALADSPLSITMAVRHRRADLSLDRTSIADAFPRATSRLAVFVHGLCETEDAWFPSPQRQAGDGAVTFGHGLAADLGYSDVYVRYNTGLHISDNGDRLSGLLDDLVRQWPVPVDEVVLVGHSMGGLVLRSACHQGEQQGRAWVDAVRHVVCLGTPHLGAPLERGVNALSWVLNRLPETRGVAGILNRRSVGIKDLRYGSLLEEDWRGVDLDEFLTDRCNEVPFLGHASYYFVGVTITRDHRHPIGAMAGDLLVQFSSASGRGRRRRIPFDIDKGHHIGELHHLELLTHPEVYAQLERWLSPSVVAV
jgi:pimeloyl-ACP methyl ester carboxylesterase